MVVIGKSHNYRPLKVKKISFMMLGSHAELSDVLSQLSPSFCVGSDPEELGKNSSEGKIYVGKNNSKVSI